MTSRFLPLHDTVKDDFKTKGFHCPRCGREGALNAYAVAHFRDRLTYTCDCGAKLNLLGGTVSHEYPLDRMVCTTCAHAKWKTTANGKLHPSGDGRCEFDIKTVPLPIAMYPNGMPKPDWAGMISRKEHPRENVKPCPCYKESA